MSFFLKEFRSVNGTRNCFDCTAQYNWEAGTRQRLPAALKEAAAAPGSKISTVSKPTYNV
jgi:hypothetical protein